MKNQETSLWISISLKLPSKKQQEAFIKEIFGLTSGFESSEVRILSEKLTTKFMRDKNGD